jgi:outer membrane immunogenic protein
MPKPFWPSTSQTQKQLWQESDSIWRATGLTQPHFNKEKLMKRVSVLATGLLALGVIPAGAADLAYKAAAMPVSRPIYDWTGLYLGLNAGYGQQGNCWDMNGALVLGFNPATPEGCNSAKGAVVGGQIGYRHQISNWVFGIEAQGDWADLTGSNASTVFSGLKLPSTVTLGLTNSDKVSAIGMFTGQIGYSFGPLLWYVKGGAAVTDNSYDGSLSFATRGFSLNATDHADAIRFGGVVGTGLEFMFADGWSVGAEYNHLFMGSQTVGLALNSFSTTPAVTLPKNLLAPGMPTRTDTMSGDLDMATIRLNYRFSSH